MKRYLFCLPVKICCVALCVLNLFLSVFSGAFVACLLYEDGYRQSEDSICRNALERHYEYLAAEIGALYNQDPNEDAFPALLQEKKREMDFSCTVSSQNDGVLYSDYYGQAYVARISGEHLVLSKEFYEDSRSVDIYDVDVYLTVPAKGSRLEMETALIGFLWRWRYAHLFHLAVCGPLSLIFLIFLCRLAGRTGEEEPKTNFFDHIPLEIYLLGGVLMGFSEIVFLKAAHSHLWLFLFCLGSFALLDLLYLVLCVVTSAARIKTKTFLSTTFVGWLWKGLGHVFAQIRSFWENIKMAPKVAMTLGALALFNLFLALNFSFPLFLLFLLIQGFALASYLLWYAAALQRFQRDQGIIAGGKLDYRCDPTRLPPGLRSCGEGLNRSAEGMERAVEEKMKSERFKTELITSVSHDIKTPLTSIINYVDLLKKEEGENPKVREYLAVLERQTGRLKKMTEDLVESSKAASGAISVSLTPCDVKLLLEQALGEYRTALESRGLEICLTVPEKPVFILADGDRLWRVLDNLFQNIEKYALSGTRVYVSLEERGELADLVFRNISAFPLNVSGERLAERFIRGDLSRNDGGSGLGLAIAQSFVELQKGAFSVTVDGDLFKVQITFHRYQKG